MKSLYPHNPNTRYLKNRLLIISTIMFISVTPLSFADSGTYKIESDEKTFDVTYSFAGELIAIDADKESTSLLIGTTNVEDSTFEIGFPSDLLSAQNAEFVVLVDGLETDYTVTYDGNNPTISFPIEADSEEIEIIGTSVVPEFPFGTVVVMGIVSAVAVLFSKTKTLLK